MKHPDSGNGLDNQIQRDAKAFGKQPEPFRLYKKTRGIPAAGCKGSGHQDVIEFSNYPTR